MGKRVEGVWYRDRGTGEMVRESVLCEPLLRWVYARPAAVGAVGLVLNRAVLCRMYGKLQDLWVSRRKIAGFVEEHGIRADEAELPLEQYRSFNEFFTRRLKAGSRPFVQDPDVLCAPGDGKALVFPVVDRTARLPAKGASFSPDALLASSDGAKRFLGGSALVLRLAPYDYHRFHFPDSGEAGTALAVRGEYHVVNPIALAGVPELLCRNKRAVTAFTSDHFGRIAYVEIGAFTVASIVQTYAAGRVTRGQEKGYFQYGGSTIILLFEPGRVAFDEDLVRDSAGGIEVQVPAGSGIGRRR